MRSVEGISAVHGGEEVKQRLARERRSTILLVTHDNRILDIADRVITMEDGRLRQ